MAVIKCEICHENHSQYKCPKCFKRYCSLACFNDSVKHVHEQTQEASDTKPKTEESQNNEIKSQEEHKVPPAIEEILQGSDKLRELLKHNTVKFHLHRVYRILKTGDGIVGNGDPQMSTEAKEQLAVDYLNTLRYGGIHYNEAVEEFCEISLMLLQSNSLETPKN
ncbi:HFL267Cp [Eremothecium sinecaudum]|uniref:HFL267Cp n=1 Tax=Eremothecium sinecaudum TaxID=45286 RepID=A0A0X8HUB5_9SACH|nr:HFL267Cp [Eremothecium sinecaudum]AMD21589.1 HFL267Cp [Eremothecium sinecaudum]